MIKSSFTNDKTAMKNRLEPNEWISRPRQPVEPPLDESDSGNGISDKLKNAAEQIKSHVNGFVEANPGKCVLAALAAGLTLGWWVKRS